MHDKSRNINIGSLIHYRFPVTAIASILHRASGILLFVFIPFLLLFLDHSMHSPKAFMQVKTLFGSFWVKFFVWVFYAAILYHIVAGLKHLLMDMGWFETKCSGKAASLGVVVIAAVLIVGSGAWMIW